MLNKKSLSVWVIGILLLFNILAWSAVFDLNGLYLLEVNFFDVGQGDAIFIETPDRYQILVDGGPDSTVLEKLAKEMPFWDRSIDLIILTHPERDHITGLLDVLKRYKVENILWTGIVRDIAEYEEWQRLIQEEGARIFIAKLDEKLSLSGELNFLILSPLESQEGKALKDSNDSSIVFRLSFKENSFLFMGDAGKAVEQKIIDAGEDIDSDVLKIGHHGSKTSSSKNFIESVSPQTAVIQLGRDNSYGHPHQEVLENLQGIEILRTDMEGDIRIISDGENIFYNRLQN
ncbi:MAG: ComEC/Rec2 family competence protein [Candidatus Parcubacteria bacterium]|nr:ComEC/Rec2 family competence protein [Candidatus Parcubacteria bacterium]